MERVLKILYDSSRKRRGLILQRSNGSFGFEAEELMNVYDEELGKRLGEQRTFWSRSTQNPLTICDSPETAEREARSHIEWLSKSQD
jgi:hypothetical protein